MERERESKKMVRDGQREGKLEKRRMEQERKRSGRVEEEQMRRAEREAGRLSVNGSLEKRSSRTIYILSMRQNYIIVHTRNHTAHTQD